PAFPRNPSLHRRLQRISLRRHQSGRPQDGQRPRRPQSRREIALARARQHHGLSLLLAHSPKCFLQREVHQPVMPHVHGQTRFRWCAHRFLATLASHLPISGSCPAAARKKSSIASLIARPRYPSGIKYVPLASWRKTLLSKTYEFGFSTTAISFHSPLLLKNVRTPNAAPQYKFCAASSPFPSAAGTGTIP